MKKLLLLLLFISPVCCFAQTDSLKFRQKEEFCEVEAEHYYSGYQIKINNKDEKSGKLTWLKDADNKTRRFNSMVGVLNYMAQYGWVMISSFAETDRGNTGNLHLLFKRPPEK